MTTDKRTAVIEFALNPQNASKSRTKAMQLAATIAHVESITLKGENLDQLVVKGKEIDAVAITVLLQKKLGTARLIDYAPTRGTKPVKETFRRLSYHPDSHSHKGRAVRPDPGNIRNGYADPYNHRNGRPDHNTSRNGYHRNPYGHHTSYPDPYNNLSNYSDWRYYDQHRIDHETYPIDQIEYHDS